MKKNVKFFAVICAAVLCLCLMGACTDKRVKAAEELIERVTPGYGSQFALEIIEPSEDGSDVFEYGSNGEKVLLRGNNTISLAVAYYNYLKSHCRGEHVMVRRADESATDPASSREDDRGKNQCPVARLPELLFVQLFGYMVGLGALAEGTRLHGHEPV